VNGPFSIWAGNVAVRWGCGIQCSRVTTRGDRGHEREGDVTTATRRAAGGGDGVVPMVRPPLGVEVSMKVYRGVP